MAISKVFYSWQSDLPEATNFDFIESSLRIATRSIRDDDSISVEPVIDRDTAGVPGAPDIAATIFEKIEESDVFVCDVSIINAGAGGRPTSNPNVLIELGYALKTHGPERIILVMNRAFGSPELLPFDLRMKRVVTYELAADANNLRETAEMLSKGLEDNLRLVLSRMSFDEEQEPESEIPRPEAVIEAVEGGRPGSSRLLRSFLETSGHQIMEMTPEFPDDLEFDEVFITGLESTIDLVASVSSVYDPIVTVGPPELLDEAYRSFSGILEGYNNPIGFSGHYRTSKFDFHRFLGHELFVSLFSFIVRDAKWGEIGRLLDQELYVENTPEGRPGLLPYYSLSEYVETLEYRNRRLKLKRRSLHADILVQRHKETKIADVVPLPQFMAADFFLYLREGFNWRPWSSLYLSNKPPRFLVEATAVRNAERLLEPLRVDSVDELRDLVSVRVQELGKLYPHLLGLRPLEFYDPADVGTR
jgi:hypothetical protein